MSRPDPRERRIRTRLAWSLGLPAIRTAARVTWGMRAQVGAGFPPPPFVIASNHLSFLDPPLIGAVYGSRVRFLALAELFGNHRLLDLMMDAFEVIEIRRNTVPLGPLRQCLAHLREGGVVAVFPEGTRVTRFGDVGFRHGAAWLSARAGVPLVGVAVTGTDRALGLDNKMHRGQIEVVVGPTWHPPGTDREALGDITLEWADWIRSVVEAPRARRSEPR